MKKNKKKSKDVSVDENEKPVESVEHTPSLVLEPSQETKNLIRKAKILITDQIVEIVGINDITISLVFLFIKE